MTASRPDRSAAAASLAAALATDLAQLDDTVVGLLADTSALSRWGGQGARHDVVSTPVIRRLRELADALEELTSPVPQPDATSCRSTRPGAGTPGATPQIGGLAALANGTTGAAPQIGAIAALANSWITPSMTDQIAALSKGVAWPAIDTASLTKAAEAARLAIPPATFVTLGQMGTRNVITEMLESTRQSARRRQISAPDLAVGVLEQSGRTMSIEQIEAGMRADGWTTEAESPRNVVAASLVRALDLYPDEVERVGRGLYRFKTPSTSAVDDEPADEAGEGETDATSTEAGAPAP